MENSPTLPHLRHITVHEPLQFLSSSFLAGRCTLDRRIMRYHIVGSPDETGGPASLWYCLEICRIVDVAADEPEGMLWVTDRCTVRVIVGADHYGSGRAVRGRHLRCFQWKWYSQEQVGE